MSTAPDAAFFAVTPAGAVALDPEPFGRPPDYRAFDLGVYEALRTYDGNRFLALDRYLARLASSVARKGLDGSFDEAALRFALDRTCTQFGALDKRVRIDVLRSPVQVRIDGGESSSRVLLSLSPLVPEPEEHYRNGVRVHTTAALSRSDPLVKDAAFAERRKQLTTGTGLVYEQLLVSPRGEILEGSSSNFYAVLDARLVTAGDGVLEGITRELVLEAAVTADIPVELRAIRGDEIPALDEAAVSSSSRALVPVVAIDDIAIGSGQPGPVCAKLLEIYWTLVQSRISRAI